MLGKTYKIWYAIHKCEEMQRDGGTLIKMQRLHKDVVERY